MFLAVNGLERLPNNTMTSLLLHQLSVRPRLARDICGAVADAPWRVLAFALALALPGVAWPDTLGDARQLSHVGEPLRLSIPVLPDGGAPLVERCLALFGPRPGDGLPHIVTAHVGVERQGANASVIVTTVAPVKDPIVRVLMRVGCDGASRSYTLFLEPAGSGRMLRAVAQAGPRLAAAGAEAPAETAPALTGAAPSIPSAAVTTIPVAHAAAPAGRAEVAAPAPTSSALSDVTPAGSARNAAALAPRPEAQMKAAARPAAPTSATLMTALPGTASEPTAPAAATSEHAAAASSFALAADAGASAATSSTIASADPKAAALEAENETLKQQVARMSGEIQRLQVEKPAGADPRRDPGALSAAPRWDVALPVLIALAGLLAVIVGGLLWHRRHGAAAEWPLAGPPSHRMASRTSLGDEPVSFRPTGMSGQPAHAEGATGPDALAPAAARNEGAPREGTALAPAPLRLQPSPEDLARELEQELKVAERSHSALERAHPELVETLTRSWGTAAARTQLAAMLAPSSPELPRMSGEAVSELRLLLRVAEDLPHRNGFDAPVGFTPPAPAW
jgi:hypothetical protein